MKTILVAVGLLMGSMSVWAETSIWTYSQTLSNNTFGVSFSGSKSGIINVTLGVEEESSGWQIKTINNVARGLFHTNATPTLTNGIPTAGTFMKIEAIQKSDFTPHFFRQNKGYLRMVDETDAATYIFNERYGGQSTSYPTATLQAGHTYYLWFAYDSESDCNFAISGFEASTYYSYTINYVYDESIIKTEGEKTGSLGQIVNAAYTSLWNVDNTTKYYVSDDATTSFTIAEGENIFEVALRPAATDAVATINAVDGDGNVLATFTGGSGIEGEAYDGYVYYTRAILYDGKFYAVPTASNKDYAYGKNGITFGTPLSITYSLDNSISYYTEVEQNLIKSRSTALQNEGSNGNRASGGHWYRIYPGASIWTPGNALTAGVYSLEVAGRNQNSSSSTITIRVCSSNNSEQTEIATLTWSNAENTIKTVQNILVPEGKCIQLYNQDGSYNSGVGVDYIILRKVYDVTDADNILGNVDKSSAFTQSDAYTLKKGETKVFTFTNHGYGTDGNSETKSWYNWSIGAYVGNTQKAFTRADFWDNELDATTGYEAMSIDGGSTKTWVDWDKFAQDMDDATIVATVLYGTDGTYTISAVQTGHVNNYIYYIDHSVSDINADELTIKLGIEYSWSELLSVESFTTATIGSTGWTTFSSNNPLALSEMTASEGEVAAYYASEVGTSSVTMMETTETVEAGTGLMLKGTVGATITIPVATSGNAISGNKLVGCPNGETLDANANYWVLTSNEGTAEFQSLDQMGAAIPAGKAYLDATTSGEARVLCIVFSSEATSIQTIDNAQQTIVGAYNLNGQRVAAPTKGLYIVNGKKVIIK